jgi:NAD(P)-dependent dehydrogenase (short-subunit alcohol dehydrogenase family)
MYSIAPVSKSDWTGVSGKRVIITGATNGIGLAAARRLAALGANLTLVARSQERAARASAEIMLAGSQQPLEVLIADLASQSSIRHLAEEILNRYPRIDVLINNAGAMYTSRRLSPDGIELTWAVNHLAPFLLTTLLLDRIIASAPARVITTASGAHFNAHIPFDDLNADRAYRSVGYTRYGETKLANIMFTSELARRLEGTGVTANCFHPGFVASGFGHDSGLLFGMAMRVAHLFGRRPEQGADTLVWLADSPDVSNVSGAYFVDRRQVRPSHAARDAAAARRLWSVSEQQTQLSFATH